MVPVKAIHAYDYTVAVLSVEEELVAACWLLCLAVEDCAMILRFFGYAFLMHRYN